MRIVLHPHAITSLLFSGCAAFGRQLRRLSPSSAAIGRSGAAGSQRRTSRSCSGGPQTGHQRTVRRPQRQKRRPCRCAGSHHSAMSFDKQCCHTCCCFSTSFGHSTCRGVCCLASGRLLCWAGWRSCRWMSSRQRPASRCFCT